VDIFVTISASVVLRSRTLRPDRRPRQGHSQSGRIDESGGVAKQVLNVMGRS